MLSALKPGEIVKFIVVTLLVAVGLSGCAMYQPVPSGYTGPVATISDSGFSENGAKAQLFVLMEVDGHAIPNSFKASAGASYGSGFSLMTRIVERQVPAKPMRVKLLASHTTGAPIHAIFSQAIGSFYSVEGVVDFSPQPNGKYVVKGELKKEESSVWIEDTLTHQPVTQKVIRN